MTAGGCFCFCSIGMMLFNKMAVQAFPLECLLVVGQMLFASLFLAIFCFQSLHVGSWKDVLRWCMVVPFFSGMLLSSILALKNAPMSLVIVMRAMSPLGALLVERFYPEPTAVNAQVIGSIALMVCGGAMYVSQVQLDTNWQGIMWVIVNSMVAVGDRCIQRLLLAENPVDMSKTSCTFANNFLGAIPALIAAYAVGEFSGVPAALAKLSSLDKLIIVITCVIGLGISYCGIWAQSLISATSFLVMVNANKFVIIFIEAFGMGTKSLTFTQILGACLSILGACFYGVARSAIEKEDQEKKALLDTPHEVKKV
eukprot:TRINITY_DN109600_c0_g1_i1.p1 TRINITY_DN109600_c0_g1~~TRINITY_DN109600_c0_g1_i1.p1  ORF type:complete len:344 (-),score=66.01 TRINITY_DN109600_c0_g1_i1:92-1027(-)